MKKEILNIGKALKKAEQQEVLGGVPPPPPPGLTPCDYKNPDCPVGYVCLAAPPPADFGICILV